MIIVWASRRDATEQSGVNLMSVATEGMAFASQDNATKRFICPCRCLRWVMRCKAVRTNCFLRLTNSTELGKRSIEGREDRTVSTFPNIAASTSRLTSGANDEASLAR